ncbi:unnamed protein product [Cladocopium goreaui]|uniref:RNase H type-1 domain-containing protein n=1 Tax=Cladocopium goreaui TaxID=2562237 RepID=A0A9P1FPB8_9DINO|nr:unnamed protein product [Cladocopium goreaui]
MRIIVLIAVILQILGNYAFSAKKEEETKGPSKKALASAQIRHQDPFPCFIEVDWRCSFCWRTNKANTKSCARCGIKWTHGQDPSYTPQKDMNARPKSPRRVQQSTGNWNYTGWNEDVDWGDSNWQQGYGSSSAYRQRGDTPRKKTPKQKKGAKPRADGRNSYDVPPPEPPWNSSYAGAPQQVAHGGEDHSAAAENLTLLATALKETNTTVPASVAHIVVENSAPVPTSKSLKNAVDKMDKVDSSEQIQANISHMVENLQKLHQTAEAAIIEAGENKNKRPRLEEPGEGAPAALLNWSHSILEDSSYTGTWQASIEGLDLAWEAFIAQKPQDITEGSTFQLVLLDVEFHSALPSLEPESVRRVKLLPKTIARKALLALLGLQPYCQYARHVCFVWHNKHLVGAQQRALIDLRHGDYIKIAVPPARGALRQYYTREVAQCMRRGYTVSAIPAYLEAQENGINVADMPIIDTFNYVPRIVDLDYDREVMNMLQLSGQHRPSHEAWPDFLRRPSPCAIHECKVGEDNQRDPAVLTTETLPAPEVGRPELIFGEMVHFLHSLQSLWDYYAERETEEEGRVLYVNTWYTDHERAPQCHTMRAVRLLGDAWNWPDRLAEAWDDWIDPDAVIDFYLIRPTPRASASSSLAVPHILIVQHPRAGFCSIHLTVIDTENRAMPSRMLVTIAPRQITKLIFYDLIGYRHDRMVPSLIDCMISHGEHDIQNEEVFYTQHGHSFLIILNHMRDIITGLATAGASSSSSSSTGLNLLQRSVQRKVLQLDELISLPATPVLADQATEALQVLWAKPMSPHPDYIELPANADTQMIHQDENAVFLHTSQQPMTEHDLMAHLHQLGFWRALIRSYEEVYHKIYKICFDDQKVVMQQPHKHRAGVPTWPSMQLGPIGRKPFFIPEKSIESDHIIDIGIVEADLMDLFCSHDDVLFQNFEGLELPEPLQRAVDSCAQDIPDEELNRLLIYTDGSSLGQYKHQPPLRAEEEGTGDTWAMLVLGERYDPPGLKLLGWSAHGIHYDTASNAHLGATRIGADVAEKEGLAWAGIWRLSQNWNIHTCFRSDSSVALGQASGHLGTGSADETFEVLRGVYQAVEAALGPKGFAYSHVAGHAGEPWNELCDWLAKMERAKSFYAKRPRLDMRKWRKAFGHLWIAIGDHRDLPKFSGRGLHARLTICASNNETKFNFIGLQETKAQEICSCVDQIYRLASGSNQHQQGVELWINLAQPYAYIDKRPMYFEKNDFQIAYKDARALLVRVDTTIWNAWLLVAYAPHSGLSWREREEWWMHLDDIVRRRSSHEPLLVMIDANASPGTGMQSHCIDYVLLSEDLQAACTLSRVVPEFDLGHGGWDHEATAIDLDWCISVAVDATRKKQTPAFDHTMINLKIAEEILHDYEPAAWNENIEQHVDDFNQQVLHGLHRLCPRQKNCAKKPYVNEHLWNLRSQKIKLKGQLRQLAHRQRDERLVVFFAAWAQARHETEFQKSDRFWSYGTTLRCSNLRLVAAYHKATYELRNGLKKSKRQLVQEKFASLSPNVSAGQILQELRPFIGPSNLKKLKIGNLPHIKNAEGQHCTLPNEAIETWSEFFRQMEGGTRMSLECQRDQWIENLAAFRQKAFNIDGQELPRLVDLEAAYRRVQPTKAVGPDGVHPAFCKAAPQLLARKTFGQLLKLTTHGQESLVHKGGVLHPVWKMKGPKDLCTSYRSILISSHVGKCLHRSIRQRQNTLFTKFLQKEQLGGRPRVPVSMGVHLGRAFLRSRTSLGHNVAMLYLDLTEAFYRILRPLVIGGEVDDTLILYVGARLGLSEDLLQELHQHLDDTPATAAAGLPAHMQNTIRALHETKTYVHNALMRLFRRLMPGSYNQHLQDEDILTETGLNSPTEVLRLARLRYIGTLYRCQDLVPWGLLNADEAWTTLIQDDLSWMWSQLRETCRLPDPLSDLAPWTSIWQHHASYWKRLVKRAGLHACFQRRNHQRVLGFHRRFICLFREHPATQDVFEDIGTTPAWEKGEEDFPQACMCCRMVFKSKGGLGAHMFKVHHLVAKVRLLCDQTQCSSCLREYHTMAKLKAHLQRAGHCRHRLWGRRRYFIPAQGSGSNVDFQLHQQQDVLPPLQAAGPQLPDGRLEDIPDYDLDLAEKIYLALLEREERSDVTAIIKEVVYAHPVTWQTCRASLHYLIGELTIEDIQALAIMHKDIKTVLRELLASNEWGFLHDSCAHSRAAERPIGQDVIDQACNEAAESAPMRAPFWPAPRPMLRERYIIHAFSGRAVGGSEHETDWPAVSSEFQGHARRMTVREYGHCAGKQVQDSGQLLVEAIGLGVAPGGLKDLELFRATSSGEPGQQVLILNILP